MTHKGQKLGIIVQILKDYDILFDNINEKILFRRPGDETYTVDLTDLLFRLYDYEQQSFAYTLENYSKRIEEETLAKYFSRYYVAYSRKERCEDREVKRMVFLRKDGKPEYKPYETVDEFVEDYEKRFAVPKPKCAMPLIWLWDKELDRKCLVRDFESDKVMCASTSWTMEELFDRWTYLDGSPVGKEC